MLLCVLCLFVLSVHKEFHSFSFIISSEELRIRKIKLDSTSVQSASESSLLSQVWQLLCLPPLHGPLTGTHLLGCSLFWVMPFCLKGAPATFLRLLNHVLQSGLGDCCIVYLDDLVIYSKDIHAPN